MAKWVCNVCGYVHEGDTAPEACPVCKAPASKFTKQEEEMTWAAEHVVGVASDVPEDIKEDLRANFTGECSEVGMYLAMARVAFREGYPEIGLYWEKAAYEEAEHAAKFAELLGEVVTDSTKKNLQMRVDAENGAVAFEIPSDAVTAGGTYSGTVSVTVDGAVYSKEVLLVQGTLRTEADAEWIRESASDFGTTGSWSGGSILGAF